MYQDKKLNYDLLFLIYCTFYVFCLCYFIGIRHSQWSDEGHFLDTVDLFLKHPSLHTLKHYNEMSTPLPFILYAIWAKLGSFDIAWLRILSIIIALITYSLFYMTSKAYFTDRIAIISVIFLSLNPYMFGISFFVYTDMLSILGITGAFYFIKKENLMMVALCSCISILSRQYAIFFTLGIGLFYLSEYHRYSQTRDVWNAAKVWATALILVPLFILWKGISPDNAVKNIYLDQPSQYHFNGLTAYIACIGIYLFPLLILYIYQRRKALTFIQIISIFVLSAFYHLMPVTASVCGIKAGFLYIGFVDKFLHTYFASNILIGIIYQFFTFIGILGITLFVKEQEQRSLVYLTVICTGCFFLIMPFSYLTWEKYILPITTIWTMTLGGITLTISGLSEINSTD